MATNMCLRYASRIAAGPFSDAHAHLQQQLLLHALLLLQEMLRLCADQPALRHHYADLAVQLFLQLAESHLRSATAGQPLATGQPLRSDLRAEEVARHVEKALDCLHTADERIDAEVQALAATSPTHSLMSRLEKYAAMQRSLRGKIADALRSLLF